MKCCRDRVEEKRSMINAQNCTLVWVCVWIYLSLNPTNNAFAMNDFISGALLIVILFSPYF